jgi:xanthine dehydrogenase accessory factor
VGEGRGEIRAALDGVVRGLLRSGYEVSKGFKVGDIDPRGKREHCFTISDKARAVGGGVLEALLMLGDVFAR